MALPVLDINPTVKIFPPIILPVAVINPLVIKLAPVILPEPEIDPPDPGATKFRPTIFPVVEINPLAVKLVNVPTLVIFGCALLVTVCAVVELPETFPIKLFP